MALRRVFAQDADFKESMFARQIAVMKGQAWNVVETLKQRDHGPLELTRRTRVCVWDDLVNIPVAIPLTRPSMEVSWRRDITSLQQEEMDIGAARSEPQPSLDLLGSPTSDLPNPRRFELTREDSLTEFGRVGEDASILPNLKDTDFVNSERRQAKHSLSNSVDLQPHPSTRNKSRFSFEFPRPSARRPRQSSSFSARRGSNSMVYEGDDSEGDLGYSAAADMERSRKKVIVERLEAVKSKNPVFTWC